MKPVAGCRQNKRKQFTGDTGNSTSENNRLSLDASVRIPELRGARLYYELDFEDTRSPLSNSVRYDADHLLGLEIRAVGVGSWRRLFVELQKTSWISQEHGTWKTGMTNGGRTLGSPLGPDALSLWLRADLEVHAVTVSPWAEWVSFSSDTYDVSGSRGVFVLAQGPQEHRQRLGVDLQAQITPRFGVSTSLFGERVGNAAFVQGSTRLNGGFTAALFFTP